MEPLIAVPARRVGRGKVDGWPRTSAIAAPTTYLDAIHRAGGREALLSPSKIDPLEASDLLGRFDGLLLLGGGDVDPSLYGQLAEPEVYGVNALRDSFEIALVKAAIDLNMPMLAICRGIQVLNVALEGSLQQHIGGGTSIEHGVMNPDGWTDHNVKIEPGCLVEAAMGTSETGCSSHHHQAIDEVAPGLRVVATSDDGIIEAVEAEALEWVVGVQWHPEVDAAAKPAHQGLFDSLVKQARIFKERQVPTLPLRRGL